MGRGSGAEGLAPLSVTATRGLQQQRARIVFFAGVEGSGHHLLEAVYKKLHASKDAPKLKLVDLVPGIDCHNVDYNESTFQLLKDRFSKLDPDPKVVYTIKYMQLSYPHGLDKLHPEARRDKLHPDVPFFKRAADEAGADLHVILLYRPLTDCLIASCIHRHFEPCAQEASTLTSNAGILAEHMTTIGRQSYHCFEYGKMESMARATDLAYGPPTRSRPVFEKVFLEHDSAKTWFPKSVSPDSRQKVLAVDGKLRALCRQSRLLSVDGFVEILRDP